MRKARLVTLATLALAALPAPAAADDLHVSDAWIPAYADKPASAPLFLTLVNTGNTADRLLGASSPAAESVSLQGMALSDGTLKAQPVKAVELPAGVPVPLAAGGVWLQLEGLKAPLRARASYTVTLKFENGGEREYAVRARPTLLASESLDNLRTDPLQQPGQPARTEGLDDALRSDPFLR